MVEVATVREDGHAAVKGHASVHEDGVQMVMATARPKAKQ